MSDLYWPGAERAGDTFDSASLLDAMVRVEEAWLGVLGGSQPLNGAVSLTGLVGPADLAGLAVAAEGGGNPVMGLVKLLRERSGEPLLHRGLTSQDVVDSALMLLLRDAVQEISGHVSHQVTSLRTLVETHRATPMAARTLTQMAVPTTFGLRAATWLTGVLDAVEDLDALRFPVQCGGAAGTMAAAAELGLDPIAASDALAQALGLEPSVPWHTTRRPVTRAGDALVALNDAFARIANDVLVATRPGIGEINEGAGGGSSTMPHKQNPVLSTLVRRSALTAPQLGATLHTASADQVDERAVGGWHVEWDTLATLVRRTVVAADQTADLLAGLRINADVMAATAAAHGDDLHAEHRSMAATAGHEPSGDYTGAADALCSLVLARAAAAFPSDS